MKNLILLLFVFVSFSCHNKVTTNYFGANGYHSTWTKLGHIDSLDCNIFVVNDTLDIRPIDSDTYGIMYFVFENKSVITEVYTFRDAHNSDKEMIKYLQWQYLDYVRERVKYRTGCLNIK